MVFTNKEFVDDIITPVIQYANNYFEKYYKQTVFLSLVDDSFSVFEVCYRGIFCDDNVIKSFMVFEIENLFDYGCVYLHFNVPKKIGRVFNSGCHNLMLSEILNKSTFEIMDYIVRKLFINFFDEWLLRVDFDFFISNFKNYMSFLGERVF